jgi:2'-5' RNA ligase
MSDAPTRLFFALVPDAAVRARLDALARETVRLTGGRTSAPDTLHLTVVFVGTVPASAVDAVREAGDAVAWEAYELSIDTLGAFARAGIAWAAPKRVPEALARSNRDLVQALAARRVATETRPYRPHVTLVRRCLSTVDAPIDPPIAWRVDGAVLMSSRLLSEGARYQPLARYPVAGL